MGGVFVFTTLNFSAFKWLMKKICCLGKERLGAKGKSGEWEEQQLSYFHLTKSSAIKWGVDSVVSQWK